MEFYLGFNREGAVRCSRANRTPIKRLLIPIPNKGYREKNKQNEYLSRGSGQEKKRGPPALSPGLLVVVWCFVSLLYVSMYPGLPL